MQIFLLCWFNMFVVEHKQGSQTQINSGQSEHEDNGQGPESILKTVTIINRQDLDFTEQLWDILKGKIMFS